MTPTPAPVHLPSAKPDPRWISIVLTTFNRRDKLSGTLEALRGQGSPGYQLEVLIMDNGSTDGTREFAARWRSEENSARRYFHLEPRGPAAARNRGVREARGEWVLLLDSDVRLEPGWFEAALQFLREHPETGLLGGKLLYEHAPEFLNAYGGELGPIGLAWDGHEGEPDQSLESPVSCLWVNSSALLVRRDAFLACGGFDEAFFYAYEEVDLGWRMNLVGLQAWCIPGARARHSVEPDPGRSDPRVAFHFCKNRLRMLLKNERGRRLLWVLPAYLGYTALDLLARGPRRPKFRALLWNLSRLPETLALRAAVQRTRVPVPAPLQRLLSRRWFPPRPLGNRRRRPLPGSGEGRGHESESDDRFSGG